MIDMNMNGWKNDTVVLAKLDPVQCKPGSHWNIQCSHTHHQCGPSISCREPNRTAIHGHHRRLRRESYYGYVG